MNETIYIKSMVCLRCKMAVQAVLEAHNIPFNSIELGRVRLESPLSPSQYRNLTAGLQHYGLELMEDRNRILVELIKTEIIRLLNSPQKMQFKLSVYLSKMLDYNYTYLANLFSELEGKTIERFFVEYRVERVKELIIYEKLSLLAISDVLNYSSVSHLCLQFKKVANMTTAEFKKLCQSEDYVWRAS